MNFMRKPFHLNTKGNTLMTVLMMGTTITLALGSTMRFMGMALKSEPRVSAVGKRDILLQQLFLYTDCAATLSAAGINPADPVSTGCPSTSGSGGQKMPFLRLRRRGIGSGDRWLTSSLDANGVAGTLGYRVRVSCSKKEKTLVVRIARAEAKNDFYGRSSLVLGSETQRAIPLCRNLF